MKQLSFLIRGLDRKRWRRIRRLSRPVNPAIQISTWLFIGGIGVYIAGLIVPNMVAFLAGTPNTVIQGDVFIGKHVVIIADISGSMNTVERQAARDRQIQKLAAAGMDVDKRQAIGFGVSTMGGDNNLLHQVEQALKVTPGVDTIYAFSDFEEADAPYWKNNREGYVRLRALLKRHGVRLYLGTVQYTPTGKLARISVESGGGVIGRPGSSGGKGGK